MQTNSQTDQIDFLVKRQFPDAQPFNMLAALLSNENGNIKDVNLPPAEIYRRTLKAKPQHEIEDLYHQEMQKVYKEMDENRFFNKPDAEADFDYWAKMPEWTIKEAVALSFGKSPDVMATRIKEIPVNNSPFIEKYLKLTELVIRAKKAKLFTNSTITFLDDQILPYKFVNWTQLNEIEFPAELAEKVLKIYEVNKPPKTEYEQTLEKLKSLNTPNKVPETPLTDMAKRHLEAKKENNKKLIPNAPKPLHTKEKETLLKIIIGLAVDGYGYDPKASKSPIPKEISGNLALHGVSVSDDTIRKWLKEAAEYLPTKPI